MLCRQRILQNDPCALALAFLLGAICDHTLSLYEGVVEQELEASLSPPHPALPILGLELQATRPTVPAIAPPGKAHESAQPETTQTTTSGNASASHVPAIRAWLIAQFDVLDKDNDGFLDKDDVAKANETMQLHRSYVKKLRGMVGNKEMSFEELTAVRGWVRTQFQMMDTDEDGLLDATDLSRISRKMNLQPSFAKKFRNRVGDREMTFDEFVAKLKQIELVAVAASSRDGRDTLQPEMAETVFGESISRATLLLGLMILQSGSAMVLGRFEALLKEHVIVMLFLTMLVGAGGNVGNQSVIKVIEQLFTGHLQVDATSCAKALLQQLSVGVLLAIILGLGGFLRAFTTQYYLRPAGADGKRAILGCIAVTAALMIIVVASTVLGTAMPLALAASGLDVAHAGPTIQVVMDIGGVIITCIIARLILEPSRRGHSEKV